MSEAVPNPAAGSGVTTPATTTPATGAQSQSSTTQPAGDVRETPEYQSLLREKNETAAQLRREREGKGVNPDDLARLNREVADLKAKDTRATERLKMSKIREVATAQGFTGERQDALIAILLQKAGSQIAVNDDDSVTYLDTAKNQRVDVGEFLKGFTAQYEFLKPPVPTPSVKGFQSVGAVTIPGQKRYAEMTQIERLSLPPDQRRAMAAAEFNGAGS